MDAKELAASLTGSKYPLRLPREVTSAAKAAGLVIVYGASDDLMEFDGAIHDEIGASDGTIAFLDAKGLTPEFNKLCEIKDWHGLKDYFNRFSGRKEIEAMWDRDGYSWTYKTDIPHETFDVVEDGEPYCRGIVFSLAALSADA